MARDIVLMAFFTLAIPVCLFVGASLGFYLLLLLYVVLALDFPTVVSILVGLTPMALTFVGLGLAVRQLQQRYRVTTNSTNR
jgi:hypothetical protein